MNAADLEFVRAFVRKQTGVVLDGGKDYLIESRLRTLSLRENLGTAAGLVAALRVDPHQGLARRILDAMMIGDTAFFRDAAVFETLRDIVLPELRETRKEEARLDLWCGACSTGQEPFSLLVTLAEHLPELLNWQLEFRSSDYSLEALERARAGRFNQLEINRGLPPALQMKYFTRSDGQWEFRADLRDRISFSELNLIEPWPETPAADIILLRNVLSQFDVDTKQSVLARARDLLHPGGFLVLGAGEQLANLVDGFESVISTRTCCYRRRVL